MASGLVQRNLYRAFRGEELKAGGRLPIMVSWLPIVTWLLAFHCSGRYPGSADGRAPERRGGNTGAPMNILVTGASGLIGSSLVPFLARHGHQVTRLVRTRPGKGAEEICWDPEGGRLEAALLDGFDAVVHLAAENIGSGRWTERRRRRILESRSAGTRLLASTLADLQRPPEVLVSTSAIGFYGDCGVEILKEDSCPGQGFLADVCHQWEQAAEVVKGRGIRLVTLRIGMVLAAAGGALPRMLRPFRMGVGGRVGPGTQYMSWIALDDLVEVIRFACTQPSLQGAVNAVAPEPVTNLAFTRTLGRVLRRPAVFPLPAFLVRLMFGEMGEELLLYSARVEPARLLAAGFQFRFPRLEAALRHVLSA